MRYGEKLEEATAKLGVRFVDYKLETGSWVFEVQHFSKYGLDGQPEDGDEDNGNGHAAEGEADVPEEQPEEGAIGEMVAAAAPNIRAASREPFKQSALKLVRRESEMSSFSNASERATIPKSHEVPDDEVPNFMSFRQASTDRAPMQQQYQSAADRFGFSALLSGGDTLADTFGDRYPLAGTMIGGDLAESLRSPRTVYPNLSLMDSFLIKKPLQSVASQRSKFVAVKERADSLREIDGFFGPALDTQVSNPKFEMADPVAVGRIAPAVRKELWRLAFRAPNEQLTPRLADNLLQKPRQLKLDLALFMKRRCRIGWAPSFALFSNFQLCGAETFDDMPHLYRLPGRAFPAVDTEVLFQVSLAFIHLYTVYFKRGH